MKTHALAALAGALICGTAVAQNTGYQGPIPELSVNNTFRVISAATHTVTGNNYPAYGPPGYTTMAGVAAGTRAWTHTPAIVRQAGSQGSHWMTIQGMTQAIFMGPAVSTLPAPNHYQFKTGIAPATPARLPAYEHATTGADIFSIAQAPLMLTTWALYEHSVTLATPVVLQQDQELLLFAEYNGGEYREDPNGGQTICFDWQGAYGPGRSRYHGWTTGTNPRTIVASSSTSHRPKIGLLISEPVLTATGHHANFNEQPPLVGEEYRGLTASYAAYSNGVATDLFFNLRAGGQYGSTGMAVVFMNVGTWFPGKIPVSPFGNFLLDPSDPSLTLLTFLPPFILIGNGLYNGEASAIQVPALGSPASKLIMKFQGIVFNQGFTNMQLTTATGIEIQ